ncbi:MAG: DUF2817 domain-containing protein [Fimbriimonadaceae bacterium]|nr:DUF2817 domain-containing protein [Fimbriimonadaceae bacterium]
MRQFASVMVLCWIVSAQASLVTTVGASFEGREILATTYGYGSTEVLVISGTHGDEIEGVWLAESFMTDLAAKESEITEFSIHIIPRLNPDGIAKMQRGNARNVDLNRNFAEGWSAANQRGFSTGSAPLSEPETAALREFILARPGIKRILSIHAPLNMLDFDGEEGKRLAQLMAERNGMRVATVGYPTPGSLGKFCQAFRIPLVTMELPRGGEKNAIWQRHQAAIWAFIGG